MKLPLGVKPRVFALLAGGVLSFGAGAVIASEFPTESAALVYSGRLTDSAGNPRTTIESVSVTLFSAANGGSSLCAASQPAVDLGATQGRFSVPLPELCLDAIADAGDAWAEVKVGSTTLPRQKLGAVPFAVVAREAQHANTANNADMADAVGVGGVDRAAIRDGTVSTPKLDPALAATITELGTQLDDLDESVAALANNLQTQSNLPFSSWRVQAVFSTSANRLAFMTELADTANELDMDNSRVVASRTGLYLVTGTFTVGNNLTDQCNYHVAFYRNNVVVNTQVGNRQSLAAGVNSLGTSISFVTKLNATDELTQWAQASCSGTSLYGEFQVTFLR
jgi:hypothetical protein